MNFIDLDGVLAKMHPCFQNNKKPREVLSYMVEHCETIFKDLEPCEKALCYVRKHFEDFKILTAIPKITHFPKSLNSKQIEDVKNAWKQSKVEWVRKYVGKDVEVLFSNGSRQKHLFIENFGDVLMDDNEKVLLDWRKVGGVPFLAFNYNPKNLYKEDFILKKDFR